MRAPNIKLDKGTIYVQSVWKTKGVVIANLTLIGPKNKLRVSAKCHFSETTKLETEFPKLDHSSRKDQLTFDEVVEANIFEIQKMLEALLDAKVEKFFK